MKTIPRILSGFALGFGLLASSYAANPTFEIEEVLLESPHSDVNLEEVRKSTGNLKVRYAIRKAESAQEQGDFEARNKFLYMSLNYLEEDEIHTYERQVTATGPRAAESSAKFQAIYGKEGLHGKDGMLSDANKGVIDDAVDTVINTEQWFVGMLEKLGILSKNYKELNDKLRTKYPHLSRDELADHLIKRSAILTGGVGLVSSLPSMIIPGGGAAKVAMSVGTMVPDMIYMFKKQATLIFRIAEIYGQDIKEDDRLTEALILFGVASGVSTATKALEKYLEQGITIYVKEKISKEAVQRGITRLGTLNPIIQDVLSTLFSKKFISEAQLEGAVTSIVPFIGAGVSGAMNYVFTKKVGQIAKVFYGDNSSERLEAINNLKLPKVELALFRALVKVIMADGLKKEVEILALNKFLDKFQHNRKLVERMLAGEEDLTAQLDFDISKESPMVKEQILYAVTVMEYVDQEKGPEEIELHDKIVEKFGIDQHLASEVEIRVKKEKNFSGNVVKSFFSGLYNKYQKAIGAQDAIDF
jgi:uncharacterized protein (DUF697 family)